MKNAWKKDLALHTWVNFGMRSHIEIKKAVFLILIKKMYLKNASGPEIIKYCNKENKN